MKALKLLLVMSLSLFNLGQGSRLAAPAKILVIYNAYALDFSKNAVTRTLVPELRNDALVNFGTFVSHVWKDLGFPRNSVFLSQTPEYSKATVS